MTKKMDTGKQSQEIMELKLKLKAEKIGRTELQAENQAIRNALREMEQSLVEQKNYINELREENIYQNVQHERVLGRSREGYRGLKSIMPSKTALHPTHHQANLQGNPQGP